MQVLPASTSKGDTSVVDCLTIFLHGYESMGVAAGILFELMKRVYHLAKQVHEIANETRN